MEMKSLEIEGFPIAERIVASKTRIEENAVTCYDNVVPPFVEGALEQLYGNTYSSIAAWRLSGAIKDASTFVLSKNGQPVTVLVFRREANKVTVINEVITINRAEIHRFAEYIFAMFDTVTVISFRAIQTDVRRLPFPYQRVNYLEDIVVQLPNLEQDYLALLGRATRKNLKRHRNRLQRDFPSFSDRVYEREEINEQQVRAIVKFNWARMAAKNKVSGFDERAIQRLISLTRASGFIWVATIDGQICAGAICDSVGTHYFMTISAHDPAYDRYRLGTLCCYLAICACIDRGGSEMHLLWGQYAYKYLLLGIQRDLDNIVIYRDHIHQLRNGNLVLKTVIKAHIRRMILWFFHHQDSFVGRAAMMAVHFLRGVRRLDVVAR